jgi:hypothetical protein
MVVENKHETQSYRVRDPCTKAQKKKNETQNEITWLLTLILVIKPAIYWSDYQSTCTTA